MPTQDLYTGKGGQLAVMAEFVIRGYNVAVPEIDRGDDIFVVRDADGDLSRIQVKTATAKPLKRDRCYTATFAVPLHQLDEPRQPELYYVLVVRHGHRWEDFLVIPRHDLRAIHVAHGIGSVQNEQGKKRLLLALSFSPTDVLCKNYSFQQYRDRWDRWPTIMHSRRVA